MYYIFLSDEVRETEENPAQPEQRLSFIAPTQLPSVRKFLEETQVFLPPSPPPPSLPSPLSTLPPRHRRYCCRSSLSTPRHPLPPCLLFRFFLRIQWSPNPSRTTLPPSRLRYPSFSSYLGGTASRNNSIFLCEYNFAFNLFSPLFPSLTRSLAKIPTASRFLSPFFPLRHYLIPFAFSRSPFSTFSLALLLRVSFRFFHSEPSLPPLTFVDGARPLRRSPSASSLASALAHFHHPLQPLRTASLLSVSFRSKYSVSLSFYCLSSFSFSFLSLYLSSHRVLSFSLGFILLPPLPSFCLATPFGRCNY